MRRLVLVGFAVAIASCSSERAARRQASLPSDVERLHARFRALDSLLVYRELAAPATLPETVRYMESVTRLQGEYTVYGMDVFYDSCSYYTDVGRWKHWYQANTDSLDGYSF